MSGAERWDEVDDERAGIEPWWVLAGVAAPDPRSAELDARIGYAIDPRAVVAPGAHVVASTFSIGARSFVAAGCVIRGEVTIGRDTSLNAGASTIGRVTIGDDVRIATGVVLVGENHVFDDLDRPIREQGLTTEGIAIEDDVWIGANVTVVDGVTIGAHSVVGAGAVVTRDVPPWSVVGGVPARIIRDRRAGRAAPRHDRLGRFADRVAAQWPDVLARCRHDRPVDGGTEATYVDTPGADWGPRPVNDAIEIAGAFGEIPEAAPRADLIARLQAGQDPATGMFVDPRRGPAADPIGFDPDHEWAMYGLLSVGYALEVLGSGPTHPVHAIEDCPPDDLLRRLDALDRGWLAWPAGAWIDAWGTGIHLNRRHHGSVDHGPALFGWLATHQSAMSGTWGEWLDGGEGPPTGWLMAVNGFYRLTRGTYAQFGLPVPRPEAALDTVLAHGRQWDWFRTRGRTACNALDVVHPMWLLSRQTGHRADEVRQVTGALLDGMLGDWVDGEGFAFRTGGEPGLQGTEMWLSIVYLAADLLGESTGLPWRPRGVHRLAPTQSLA